MIYKIQENDDVRDATQEEIKQIELQRLSNDDDGYAKKRQLEYPSFLDYLDGIVKNDQTQIQTYINDCLAVKAKYPKPGQTK
jgi:hypothetical protein